MIQVRIDIPESWLGKEVHLRWSAGCESMVWTSDGIPLQGLNGKHIFSVNVSVSTLIMKCLKQGWSSYLQNDVFVRTVTKTSKN